MVDNIIQNNIDAANMSSPVLNKEAIQKLMKQTKDKRIYQRYNVIYLHLCGMTNKDISSIVGLCQHTVGNYVQAFNSDGILGLNMGKSPGLPRFLTKDQEQELFKVITTSTPDEVGFTNKKNWNSKLACEWVKQNFGVKYTPRGMLDVLWRLNLRM